ncbi:hypothetical protein LTR84_003390 [Exophiala bonariae]|uniref:DUF6594 domain-containing protein n=1 Tax=Exophiala bonariae TaxID=1690606 RepID=A0AAV9N9L2_9EURO|nr:hypothetical protein LTR84_003390 [Exophiala bonariae]
MAPDQPKFGNTVTILRGFGSLAHLIASDVDHSTEVYRRFGSLSARDLLYYEAELAECQALQEQYDLEDAVDAGDDITSDLSYHVRKNARNWQSFTKGAEKGYEDERWKKRMDLAMRARGLLREYREALIQESTLLALRPPSKQTMTALSKNFHQEVSASHSSDGQATTDSAIMGVGARLYPLPQLISQSTSADHVSLVANPQPDLLTYFLKTHCSRLFRTKPPPALPTSTSLSHLNAPQLTHYSLHYVNITTFLLTTILSAVLLFLPIYVLYNVSASRPGLTLGLIAMFTTLFAITVALITNARKAEIFGSCAAYAAVLVVFVSGDFAGSAPG